MSEKYPIKLFAKDVKDLEVISTLCQDAVGLSSNIRWLKGQKKFSILVNRFKWEDKESLKKPRRISSIIFFQWVLSVKSLGFKHTNSDDWFSLLHMKFEEYRSFSEVHLLFSGDAEICLEVEYLEAFIKDIGKSYVAPSRRPADHVGDSDE